MTTMTAAEFSAFKTQLIDALNSKGANLPANAGHPEILAIISAFIGMDKRDEEAGYNRLFGKA